MSQDLNITEDSIVRIATAGSVDDGKSTLLGRLLIDCKGVYEDQIYAAKKRSEINKNDSMALALLTDGLKAEREQGITIDVAYRFFSTAKRRFILADTPGHEQYTRNMATGASTADVSLLVVDATRGISTQTKRHAFISALLGVPRSVVAVNKMDLVGYKEEVFQQIRTEFEEFAAGLLVKEIRFVPISALEGDNVVQRSSNMPWFEGETLLSYLENVYVAGDRNLVDFRFPVQLVVRPTPDYRGYAGTIASGRVSVGDEICVLPSGRKSRIKTIDLPNRDSERKSIERAESGMSVTLTLEDEVDLSRGDMIVRELNMPQVRNDFEAMLVWMHESPMEVDKPYLVLHTSRFARVFIKEMRYRIDVNTLHRDSAKPLELNEIGRATLSATSPLFLDSYRNNRSTGSFILVDPHSYRTVAAGMVVDRLPDEPKEAKVEVNFLHRENSHISRATREQRLGGKAVTFWFTGLSGSGKSSLAKELEQNIYGMGREVMLLDGDNLRHGLSVDLGFSTKDRNENIRRAAHVARFLNEAGISVLACFISPLREQREMARSIVGKENFHEIFMSANLATCEARDPHGLYKKARAGEIAEFSGISAPFEQPTSPALSLDSGKHSVQELLNMASKFFVEVT